MITYFYFSETPTKNAPSFTDKGDHGLECTIINVVLFSTKVTLYCRLQQTVALPIITHTQTQSGESVKLERSEA